MASSVCGFRPRWVLLGRLAVSGMPCQDDVPRIASVFRTVVSLSTPIEHSSGLAYDPRSLRGLVERLVWLPVGEYNAPRLGELVEAVERAVEPVLVHCYRGCGRSSVYAAAWLVARTGARLPEALTGVSSATGCNVETRPQHAVLRAFDTLYQLRDRPERLGAREEYALLLYRELRPRLNSTSPFSPELMEAAGLLEERTGYNIADIEARLARDSIELRVTCWVERGAHPAAARSWGCRLSENDVTSLARILGRLVGVDKIRVKVVSLEPERVPWL
ncbi:protein-tyrosine phosphatase family protein [Hyperthermus butylicus]|uniref:Dual specificity phosphatase, catalytic domain n=1 Tax=Hyperthermus butylicus (strain DSM 5456 / JCM 9403 / PLM1-5) TaxID=415426 RepID=A2BJS8_HYPBU|nr:dual specificity protein phosphatase family protein [Hyperthermus butylicus]ABM80239.1 Dual specificity phosphatase, catalytic domain [Hyperthermus butylicus DSM 5456]